MMLRLDRRVSVGSFLCLAISCVDQNMIPICKQAAQGRIVVLVLHGSDGSITTHQFGKLTPESMYCIELSALTVIA